MTSATEVDVVVVGLGPGGEYAANKLASAGLRVIGVERHLVGGECPFYGCMPSKMMIRASDSLEAADDAGHLAAQVEVTPDWSKVARRIDKQGTNHWNDKSHVDRLEAAGVEIVRGHGRLDGAGRVVVATDDGERVFTASRGVVINPGTQAAVPPIDGLKGTPFLTNREVVKLTELPASLVVLGGGPIGCELAQVMARFGVHVTIVEAGDRIMGPEEPETSALIDQVLTDDGITIRAGVSCTQAAYDAGFRLTLDDGSTVEADQVLVATGRTNQLANLGLETVGLDPEAHVLEPDERMRIGDRLWAVGDATGHGAFTHVSMYQGEIAVRDILGADGPWADYRAVSRVTFTDPEVGSVGLTEAQAREKGLAVVTSLADLAQSSRGWVHQRNNRGLIKLVADADRGVLVGASAVGPAGGEILGLLVAAVHAEIPVATLKTMHYAYPTFHRTIEVAVDGLDLT